MTTSDTFVSYLIDQLAPFGAVSPRRMFGGCGLFRDGLMIALIADETLYLKADAACRTDFEAAGAIPFTYLRAGKRVALSYLSVPAEVLDDRDALSSWAEAAFAAARRSARHR